MTDKDAANFATSVVIKTQASMRPEDRAAYQNLNNPFARAFGMFYGFFITMYNLERSVSQSWQSALGVRSTGARAAVIMAAYATISIIPLALGEALMKTMRGEWAEDDAELQDQIMKMLAGISLTAGITTRVPIVGGSISASIRKGIFGEDVYIPESWFNSPGVSLVTDTIPRTYKNLTDGEFNSKDILSLMQTITATTGIVWPAVLARPLAGAYDMYDTGNTDHPIRALITGKAEKE